MDDAVVASVDQLVVRAAEGDAEAFADLVARHGHDVLRLCMVITTDRMLAEDAAQNTWQQAWRRLHTVREPRSLRSWLLRVAANESKQLLRRNRKHTGQSLDLAAELPAAAVRGDTDIALREALTALAPGERELLAQSYVLGMTSEEIGSQLGISAEGVRSRLKRLRDRMHKEMEYDD